MLTLNVFNPGDGSDDRIIEDVTLNQLNSILSETQSDVRIIALDYLGGSVKLQIGNPRGGSATLKIITRTGADCTEFDNTPDAINAFQKLTAPLFN